MGLNRIPPTYEHICDGCKATHVSASSARPRYWCDLTVAQEAYDFQGNAVANGSIERLLCPICKEKVVAAINSAMSDLPAKSQQDDTSTRQYDSE